ncbi:hypothetical protein ACEQ6A_32905, partial [Rhizobium brockwellii]|uniref:hypothetical protein n=1 Tax=Rhizobium brockwellii TaxID=3019932 RepID=UPI003F9C7C77
ASPTVAQSQTVGNLRTESFVAINPLAANSLPLLLLLACALATLSVALIFACLQAVPASGDP